MTNRIDDLIKKGIDNPVAFEKELSALSKKAKLNPEEKNRFIRSLKKV